MRGVRGTLLFLWGMLVLLGPVFGQEHLRERQVEWQAGMRRLCDNLRGGRVTQACASSFGPPSRRETRGETPRSLAAQGYQVVVADQQINPAFSSEHTLPLGRSSLISESSVLERYRVAQARAAGACCAELERSPLPWVEGGEFGQARYRRQQHGAPLNGAAQRSLCERQMMAIQIFFYRLNNAEAMDLRGSPPQGYPIHQRLVNPDVVDPHARAASFTIGSIPGVLWVSRYWDPVGSKSTDYDLIHEMGHACTQVHHQLAMIQQPLDDAMAWGPSGFSREQAEMRLGYLVPEARGNAGLRRCLLSQLGSEHFHARLEEVTGMSFNLRNLGEGTAVSTILASQCLNRPDDVHGSPAAVLDCFAQHSREFQQTVLASPECGGSRASRSTQSVRGY